MLKKIDEHQFTGMQRDMTISKQKPEFLWDANNIRLTARHGDTLLSITNERGTKKFDSIIIDGIVLGYCVLGEYLTVFTTNGSNPLKPDYIYRLLKQDNGFDIQTLYNGNLNFNVNSPIECLGVYENESIQKIYWTDGTNQPRFINITKDKIVPKDQLDTIYNEDSFDFIPTLSLKDSIHVKKVADSSGLFAAGVIQYAVTYYNKYGQESNVSVVSPLIATSYTSRAGSPEETIGNAFKVTVKNPDTHFEYLRVYSIFRSTKNATPTCKRVADVKLGYGGDSLAKLYMSNDKQSITFARVDISTIQVKISYDAQSYVPIEGNIPLCDKSIVTPISHISFEANKYYHLTKQDYPELIIKAYVISLKPLPRTMYLTWDTCTDIYISTEGIAGPGVGTYPIILASGGVNPLMAIANDIHFAYEEFISNHEVTITDNGTIGEDVDYNELLFVGGEEITAGTLTLKDGTMFLGDITVKRPQITGKYIPLPNTVNTTINLDNVVDSIRRNTQIDHSHRYACYPHTMNSSCYRWGNTLDAHICNLINGEFVESDESTNVAGFKHGEHYRLGLLFQYKTGKWSQPIFIKDEKNDDQHPSLNPISKFFVHQVPTFTATLSQSIGNLMIENGYQRVRAVVCFPTESDLLVLCQGLLNPTVHSIAGRINHTPDVQSSWYFRPVPAGTETNQQTGDDTLFDAGIPQYLHGYSLYSGKTVTSLVEDTNLSTIYPTRHDEIQGVPPAFSGIDCRAYLENDYASFSPNAVGINVVNVNVNQDYLTVHDWLKYYYTTDYDKEDLTNIFVVDCNYLTFHSPEFEFNDSFHNIDTTTLGCKITGRHLVSSNQGDIHIVTSSTPISSDATGFYHRVIFTGGVGYRINAGLFYKDCLVEYDENNQNPPLSYKGKDPYDSNNHANHDSNISSFLIYPWHRTGSLNNDCVRPQGYGNRTAVLSQKKMINLMYFGTMANDTSQILQITKTTDGVTTTDNAAIKVFNSDLVALVKINDKNYFGNVDQVLSSIFKYNIGYSTANNFSGSFIQYVPTDALKKSSNEKGLGVSNDPVYMKYKSTPHAIIYTNTSIDQSLGNSPSKLFDNKAWPYLYCAEIYRDELEETDFGGTSANAIHNNLWYPAGPAVQIGYNVDGTPFSGNDAGKTEIPFWYGDTYYQRYDCLKTYPFTDEDTNSIMEIGSFMVETRVNMDGRYDKNRGNTNNFFLNPTNFNLINPVYSQMDNFFNYRILDEDYYNLSNYPTMVTWTGYKNNAAEVDNWTNITLASTLEMDGTKGKVNAVRVNSDQLYCFQDDAVGQILFNSRVLISPSDGVPIEISNNYKVDGNRYISTSIGCKNKWSIIEGIDGLYFIDNNTEALYMMVQGQLKPISSPLNMSYWFMSQDCGTPWVQHYWDNDYEFDQKGIRCFYDSANADLYICTPETTLCYSEKLAQFISFFDYHNIIGMFNIDSDYYALNYPETNHNQGIKLWSMFNGSYNTFFDNIYGTEFTLISNENFLNDKIFTNIELRGDFRWWLRNDVSDDYESTDHAVQHRRMFDTIRVWNEYQDTGDVNLEFINDIPSNMKKKFRIWRMNIPRDKDNSLRRIRNTWCKVKFTMNTPITMEELFNMKTSSEFVMDNNGQWNPVDFSGVHTQFIYDAENQCIVEKTLGNTTQGVEQELARYYMDVDKIIKVDTQHPLLQQIYAYRKLHDMEIHDVGIVYFI